MMKAEASYNVPETRAERKELREAIAQFVQEKHLVPPVALHTLKSLAAEFIQQHQINAKMESWLMVEIHNYIWLPTVSAIPYDRRLLLLPKCLNHAEDCQAEIDEMGLLCHRCGKCHIPSLQDRAAELGVLSMVAEGFTNVIELIENQVVDAVIGVSCLDSLEKAFPLLVSHAVPGIAIPLNINGCRNTNVDVDYVMQLLPQHHAKEIHLLNYDLIKNTISDWFTRESLQKLWNTNQDAVQQTAFDWLAVEGKRRRPFLLAAVYQAITGNTIMPREVQMAAVAVECFHKASLVHDDIQDQDPTRYGRPTVHAIHGEAIAINIGDLLLGEGYRLLAACPHRELLSVIADAHVDLCQGQGKELAWTKQPTGVTLDFVLDIFAHKTVPAFEVALMMGLICADAGGTLAREVLKAYCLNLGIAYQMNDDIEDYLEDNVIAHRPTVILAIQSEHPDWNKEQLLAEAQRLLDEYHQQALNVLGKLENIELKRLLFQVTEKMLSK